MDNSTLLQNKMVFSYSNFLKENILVVGAFILGLLALIGYVVLSIRNPDKIVFLVASGIAGVFTIFFGYVLASSLYDLLIKNIVI